MLAVFVATLVRAVSLEIVAARACLILMLETLFETMLQLLQPMPKLSVFHFQSGDPSAKLFYEVVDDP
jgi:hypothetical protein